MAAEAGLATAGCLLEGLKFLPQHHKSKMQSTTTKKVFEKINQKQKDKSRTDMLPKVFFLLFQAHARKKTVSIQKENKPDVVSVAVETHGCKTGITRLPIKFLFTQ